MTTPNVSNAEKSQMMYEYLPNSRKPRKIVIIISNISTKRYIWRLPTQWTDYMHLISSLSTYDDSKRLQHKEITDDFLKSTKITT